MSGSAGRQGQSRRGSLVRGPGAVPYRMGIGVSVGTEHVHQFFRKGPDLSVLLSGEEDKALPFQSLQFGRVPASTDKHAGGKQLLVLCRQHHHYPPHTQSTAP